MSGPLSDVNLHLVDDVDTAFDLMRWLSTKDEISVDTEGTGINVLKDRVRLVQVGDADVGWAIPWDTWNGVFHEVVKKFEGSYNLHNAPYDVEMLDRMSEGTRLPRHRVYDTRPMAHIIHPNKRTALKATASRLVDPTVVSAQSKLDDALSSGGKDGGWTWETVPIDYEPYWTYGALDPVLTQRIKDILWPKVQLQAPKAFQIENAVQWSTRNMEILGAHIDVNYAKKYQREFDSYCKEVESWCKSEYGVSPGSSTKIIKALQDDGVDFTKKTASGALSLDKEVLSSIDHPLAIAVLKRRQLQKLSSTYLGHFINEVDSDDLIHCSINSLGARTSRMTISGPGLQTLPRRSAKNRAAEIVRNCITTRYDDGMLLFCDFDQIEMRLMAAFSGDQGLINAFKNPGDFFVNLAQQIFEDPTITKSDPRRQITKNAGYAKIYGAGIEKFAATAGIEESQAAKVMGRFDSLYHDAYLYQQRVVSVATQRRRDTGTGYFESPITGRHHVADKGQEYAVPNYITQGGGAEVFKTKILECEQAGLGDFMILPVHDEIILDVPGDRLKDVAITLRDIMNDTTMFDVPITASVAYGKRWGEKKDLVYD